MPEINYLAVLSAAIISMVLGGLWYGPWFGRLWMQGQGWDPDDKAQMEKMKKSAGPAYAQMFVGSLLTAFALAYILRSFSLAMPEVYGIPAGLQAGFLVWLGFILPVKYGEKLWAGKKLKYVSVDLGYYLVLLLTYGVILSLWQ